MSNQNITVGKRAVRILLDAFLFGNFLIREANDNFMRGLYADHVRSDGTSKDQKTWKTQKTGCLKFYDSVQSEIVLVK